MAPVNSCRRGATGSYEAAEPPALPKHRPCAGTCGIALALVTDLLAYPNVARVLLDTGSAVLPRRLNGGLRVPGGAAAHPAKSDHCDQHATGQGHSAKVARAWPGCQRKLAIAGS